ncbi:hypothetical protein GGU10DRAFT_374649 [Lentinula aff. detonsa]|uniref:Uncharacterized protein n=1 Tax=Lentinula aff. detonsa TaxID=2804958 RepID=A0AA38NDC1_9AGAR|nr:hypothetical protein GGU10DRAFT_374649 [Lentinula aff. detonsa]
MSNRNLRSQRTQSDPAVPSALDTTSRMDKPETRSDSPLTPIESEGLLRAPSPKGQGYESALSEPDEAESFGPVENDSKHPKTSGAKGGREEPPALHQKSRTEEPAVKTNAVTNVNKRSVSLSLEQELTIQMAEANLSQEQRERLEQRQSSVRICYDHAKSNSRGPDDHSRYLTSLLSSVAELTSAILFTLCFYIPHT